MHKDRTDDVAYGQLIAMIMLAAIVIVGSGVAIARFMTDDMPSFAPLPRAGAIVPLYLGGRV